MSTTLTEDVSRELAESLAAQLGEELVRVSLFGSRARGEARLRSDFDFVVVLKNASGEARSAVHRLATELELERNVDLSTKILDLERFERLHGSPSRFWRNFARDERIVWPKTKSACG